MSYIGTEPKDIRSFGRTQFDYTATQGQTAFTGADDDGKVLAFTTGQINVFVNGILMDDSDFTTTGTGTVTLASAANLNDIISIVSFESNIPDNDYVPASGGTFSGAVTHSGTVTNSGNVTVGGTLGVTGATTLTGNTTVGGTLGATGKITSTAGITFGSDTAVENVLDDYEYGNCTLTNILGHISSGFVTPTNLSQNYAHYVKIGEMVTIKGAITATYTAGKVALSFHVPFATLTAADLGQVGVCTFYPNETTGSGYILDYTGGNSTQTFLVGHASTSGTNKQIYFSLTYRTSA